MPGHPAGGHEAEVCDVFGAELAATGFDVEFLPIPEEIVADPLAGVGQTSYTGRANVLGRRGHGDGPSLLLNGRLDVVPAGTPELWSSPPFRPARRDGRLYGRGAGDMKCGFAMGMLAVRALDKVAPGFDTGRLMFLGAIEEECTGNGTLSASRARFLLVDQSRVDALSASEINWADAVPLQQLPTLSKDPRFTYKTSPVAGIPDFLAMNVAEAPFDKKEVRQAIAWAIDRKVIKDIAYFGSGEAGVQEVPSGSPWYDGIAPFASGPNIDKAKQLLADAGYPNGLTIHYLGLPQYPELLKTGEVVAEALKKIGITMQIEQVDVSVWFDSVQDDCPLIFVHYETLNYLMQKNVSGSVVNPTLELNLEDVAFTG